MRCPTLAKAKPRETAVSTTSGNDEVCAAILRYFRERRSSLAKRGVQLELNVQTRCLQISHLMAHLQLEQIFVGADRVVAAACGDQLVDVRDHHFGVAVSC
jgi:hypothetical protein